MVGVSEDSGQGTEFGLDAIIDQITTESLTQSGIDGRAMPRLAKSWLWNSDETRLRLKLRQDVILHDGRRFDSQLAAEALASAIANGANRARFPALNDVTAALPDGASDLVLVLSRRSALLPEDLTVHVDIPAGPYRPVRNTENGTELERFDAYYMGTPSIRRVTLQPFDTLRTSWAKLLRGDVDVVYDVSSDALEFVQSENVVVAPVKRWYQYTIAFNSRSGPLASPLVRRALNLAIDREALVKDVLKGMGTPASGPLWPEYWAADPAIGSYPFDPSQAEALLDAAGYRVAISGPGTAATRLRITCLIPENFSKAERIALHVQKALFDIGVDMQFRVAPLPEFARLMGEGEFEATLLDMISGPTPGRAYIFWGSARELQGGFNIFGYENPEAERLFQIIRTTRNEVAVRSATRRLQRVMLDDPPGLFLAWSERARAIRRNYEFPKEPGIDPLFTLWRWTQQPDTLIASGP